MIPNKGTPKVENRRNTSFLCSQNNVLQAAATATTTATEATTTTNTTATATKTTTAATVAAGAADVQVPREHH